MSVNIQESFQKMALGDKIILIAGPVLLIDSFLKWYSASTCVDTIAGRICGGGSASGWEAPGSIWSILAVLIGIVMSGTVAAVAFGNVKLPALPEGLTWARVDLGAAGAAALFIIIKLLNHSGDLAFGFFIGIICVAALVAGAFLNYQAEREGGSTPASSSM